MGERWEVGDPLPGIEPNYEIGILSVKTDHEEPCGICAEGSLTAAAACWPEPYRSEDLGVLDRTEEVARGD